MNQGAGEAIVDEGGAGPGWYSTFVSILIAIVSVVGALVAWRVAVALSDAGTADTRGVVARMDKADTEIEATINVFGQKTVYASFVTNKSVADGFYALGNDYLYLAYAFHEAANKVLDFLPRKYLGPDESFDTARDLGESTADYALNRDTNSQPYFDAADHWRLKAQWLLLDLIWLGGALLMLTLSDAIQNVVRHLCLLAGISILISGSLALFMIERLL